MMAGVDLPDDMPEQFKEMLLETTTFYDFFSAFLGFSSELTEQQKSFRSLLQYLRKQNLIANAFETLGIKGFDGKDITNREVFLETYSAFCLKDLQQVNSYTGFVRMYYCLEFLGIVSGKAQKQKMLNLANDGRHAFFGGYCDIIVSKDGDFLNKARFIYNAIGIYPCLMSAIDFYQWLEAGPRKDDNMKSLMDEVHNIAKLECIDQRETETTKYTSYTLGKIYFEYFNVLTVGEEAGKYFFYFSAEKLRFSKGALVLEIKLLLNLLLADLGPDLQNKGRFFEAEMSEAGWPGRAWLYGDFIAELLLNDGLHLTFNAVEAEQ
jgi:hypothetical protein